MSARFSVSAALFPVRGRQRHRAMTMVLLIASALSGVAGIGVGSTGMTVAWQAFADPLSSQIMWDIRVPRILGAWAAGTLLGLAGAVAQGLFRNPLADPFLLGSASGSSLGVALALAASGGSVYASSLWSRLGLTAAAFVGAVTAVLITLLLAKGVQQTYRLLLAGVVVGMVLGALTSLITLLAPETLQAMQAFMLGTTGFVGWQAASLMTFTWLTCVALSLGLARTLDGLALGEPTAVSLGLHIVPVRAAMIAIVALTTAAAVAQTGLISFIGLVAPHLVRATVKVTHGWLLLLSSLMGGLLLLVGDVLARGLLAPQEIPLGILTSVLGGAYLLWLMHRRGSWQQ